ATKRGGEMGFTLGRFDPDLLGRADCRVAVDAEGRVVGLVSWHRYDAGRARVLDLMRRAPDAPNATMDALIAESLIDFAAAGVERDRKSTRLNSSHSQISYAVFCLKKKKSELTQNSREGLHHPPALE